MANSLHGHVAASIAVRAFGAMLALAANVLLARTLGVAGYGRYMTLLSAALLLATLAVGGANVVLVRELAGGDLVLHRALARWVMRRAGPGVLLAVIAYAAWLLLPGRDISTTNLIVTGTSATVLIILCAALAIQVSALNGLDASIRSQVLQLIVQNAGLLIFAAICVFALRMTLDANQALGLQAASYAVTTLFGWFWLRGHWSAMGSDSAGQMQSGAHDARRWSAAARSFLLMTVASLLVNRFDVILVSTLAGDQVAGMYAAGARLAQVALMVALALNTVLAPRFASAWHRGDIVHTRRLFLSALALTVPVAIAEVAAAAFFATDITGILGSGYEGASTTFVWVTVAYAIWTLSAPVIALLSMTGGERTIAVTSWLILAANFGMIYLLVPAHGAVGAGIAMTTGYALVFPVLVLKSWAKLKNDKKPKYNAATKLSSDSTDTLS